MISRDPVYAEFDAIQEDNAMNKWLDPDEMEAFTVFEDALEGWD